MLRYDSLSHKLYNLMKRKVEQKTLDVRKAQKNEKKCKKKKKFGKFLAAEAENVAE